MNDFAGLLLSDAFWSALAALGFATLFNVPRRSLIGCMVCGALGHMLRTLCVQLGIGLEMSTLIGATNVGFLAVWLGHRHHTPAMIFSVSGAIPMVPGVFAYQTMIGVIEVIAITDATAGVQTLLDVSINAIRAGLILGALAVGITAPMLLFDRPRPVV